MKSIKMQLALSMFLIIGPLVSLAQESKVDVVTKLDGKEMRGKVTKVGSDAITFVYDGEDLPYEVKKSEIHKITFSSGRTEVINKPGVSTGASQAPASTPAERKGKIAVLPFDFTTNNQGLQGESFETRAQTACVNSLQENTSGLTVQDARVTNSILAKANLDAEKLAAMLPTEVAKILGVEYVTYGTLNVDNEGARTYGSQVTSYKDKEEKKYGSSKKSTKGKGTAVSSGSSSTTITYDVRVGLTIYNDQGNNIYSDSREPFGSGMDDYNSSLDYMIKRTPFGSKHK